MPTYVYETVPSRAGAKPRRFEVRQSMNDKALTRDPETGEKVRRVITGGYGVITQRASPPVGPCGSPCENPCGCACDN